jgi:hypothetical protein
VLTPAYWQGASGQVIQSRLRPESGYRRPVLDCAGERSFTTVIAAHATPCSPGIGQFPEAVGTLS